MQAVLLRVAGVHELAVLVGGRAVFREAIGPNRCVRHRRDVVAGVVAGARPLAGNLVRGADVVRSLQERLGLELGDLVGVGFRGNLVDELGVDLHEELGERLGHSLQYVRRLFGGDQRVVRVDDAGGDVVKEVGRGLEWKENRDGEEVEHVVDGRGGEGAAELVLVAGLPERDDGRGD